MAAALLVLLLTAAAGSRLGDLTRRDAGDLFTLIGEECNAAQCAEHGAGAGTASVAEYCACACPQRAPLFREDRELCVDDLPECSLATFGTDVSVQRIPFVFLPLKGQIIHPSREIVFQGVKTPICAVSGAQFLTRNGFVDLRNTLDADVPFSLFRDEGRTFLQWSGEDDLRTRMSGRVMVVRLLCRDVAATPASPLDLRGVFTPCVAFRVQGTPPRHIINVTEVQFTPNAHTSEVTATSGLTVTEYVAIGISSLLLGLIYVASVFLYLHIKKRRKAASEEGNARKLKGLRKKDGSAITERDIIRINNERINTLPNPIDEGDGVVKKNPLLALSMNRQFHDIKNNFASDSGSNLSDSEDFADSSALSEENSFNNQTSAIIHPHHPELSIRSDNSESNHRDESSIERLPDEHVSIIETTDDREIVRPVGTTRRKLYFNPAYFEPHLMAEPPAAAIEFLTKIREVIAIAKHKMAAKRFQPVLNEIPEEETYASNGNNTELYQGLGSQRSGSMVSLKRENSRKKSANCLGCPGCKVDDNKDIQTFIKYDMPSCSNCLNSKGDKQNSIRKWLENVPMGKQQMLYNDIGSNTHQNSLVNSLLSLPVIESRCKIRRQNTFSVSASTENFSIPKQSGTLSVKSEPPRRNYGIPLPEFDNMDYHHNNDIYRPTNSRDDDITPIGLSDYRVDNLRSIPAVGQHRSIFTNKNTLPDMINEAMALDHCSKLYNQNSSDEERFVKKALNTGTQIGNNSDSPSGNDYETDSLERMSNKKRISTPTEYTDVPSSQASPSLSAALPLEEELTMKNAVYKTHSSSNSNTPSPQKEIFVEQNTYETVGTNKDNKQNTLNKSNIKQTGNSYSLVSEVYVNNNYNFGSTPTSPSGSECSMGSRKLNRISKNNTEEKPGCLTIEVKDPPENYIKIHESDGFEPDTLDRKHAKSKEIVETTQFSRKYLLKNINNNDSPPNQRIQLRSSGTFKKVNDKIQSTTKFNSLRYEYEHKNSFDRGKLSPTIFSGSKSLDDNKDDTWDDSGDWNKEEGRILTLELRHSKRQRQCTPPTVKQLKHLARPDILPPLPPNEESPIYEQPVFPPRRVEGSSRVSTEIHQKNLNGRSLSPRTYMKNMTIDSASLQNSTSCQTQHGPSCSPMRASVHHSLSSDYEISDLVDMKHNTMKKLGDFCRVSSKRRSERNRCSNGINTNTFIKGHKEENHNKLRLRRQRGATIEDSGYLSSDSTIPKRFSKKLIVAKIVSCSESDDTENEARSESGAESVETHSVYFGSFRKLQTNSENLGFNNNKVAKDGNKKHIYSKGFL